jgi:radical SAM protein with 4Fe4S-binding SPASM domain
MEVQPKVYKKHHSFQTFNSSLKTDLPKEQARIVNCLSRALQGGRDEKQDVLQAAFADLSLADQTQAAFKITPHIADEVSKLDDAHIPRYIFHRYRYDTYPKAQKIDDFPPYLQIEPTSICNYRCVFCYQTDEEFTQKSSSHMGTMSLAMFKDIIDRVEGKVDFISLASRGEPLACKDIDAMLEYTVGKFIGLKINTNASLLNEKHAHAILAGGINTVVFSADAAKEPLYSQLRVRGNLEKVLSNIRQFLEIKNKHYSKSKIITRVSGVKFKDDQDMDSMLGLWGGIIDQVSFVSYNPWENVYEAPMSGVSAPCSDLWRRMFIWFDGKVNPCDTDYKSMLSVGNINEKSMTELWQSDGYNRLREAHLKNKRSLVSPCQRCVVV